MNILRRFFDVSVLGGGAFVLSSALLPLILAPGDTPLDGNPTWKLILAVTYLGVAVILAADYRQSLLAIGTNWCLVGLVLFALLSCLWAYTPTLVLQRSIAVLGATLFGLALAVRLSLEEQLRLLSGVFRIIAVLSLLCIILAPRTGISAGEQEGYWRGIFGHKNGLGQIMALSVLVEWLLPARAGAARFFNLLALALSAVLLFFSNSITAMIALVASLLFIQVYRFARQRLRIPMFAIVCVIVVVITSSVLLLATDNAAVTAALGRTSSLTGRTEIWQLVASYAQERPILGYGFSGFWGGAAPESLALNGRLGFQVMYSHNGYLDIFLTLGAVGLLISLVLLGIGIKRAFYRSERNESSIDFWPLAFVFYFAVHNVAECTILTQDLEWALFVAAIVSTGATLAAEPQPQVDYLLLQTEEYS